MYPEPDSHDKEVTFIVRPILDEWFENFTYSTDDGGMLYGLRYFEYSAKLNFNKKNISFYIPNLGELSFFEFYINGEFMQIQPSGRLEWRNLKFTKNENYK